MIIGGKPRITAPMLEKDRKRRAQLELGHTTDCGEFCTIVHCMCGAPALQGLDTCNLCK